MDFDEVIPTSDHEEEELEYLDDMSQPKLIMTNNHLLLQEPNTPSKRRTTEGDTPRKRRKVPLCKPCLAPVSLP